MITQEQMDSWRDMVDRKETSEVCYRRFMSLGCGVIGVLLDEVESLITAKRAMWEVMHEHCEHYFTANDDRDEVCDKHAFEDRDCYCLYNSCPLLLSERGRE